MTRESPLFPGDVINAGEDDGDPQPETVPRTTGAVDSIPACSRRKLGKFIGRGAETLLVNSLALV